MDLNTIRGSLSKINVDKFPDFMMKMKVACDTIQRKFGTKDDIRKIATVFICLEIRKDYVCLEREQYPEDMWFISKWIKKKDNYIRIKSERLTIPSWTYYVIIESFLSKFEEWEKE